MDTQEQEKPIEEVTDSSELDIQADEDIDSPEIDSVETDLEAVEEGSCRWKMPMQRKTKLLRRTMAAPGMSSIVILGMKIRCGITLSNGSRPWG